MSSTDQLFYQAKQLGYLIHDDEIGWHWNPKLVIQEKIHGSLGVLIGKISDELKRATLKHKQPSFHSAHEGYAITKEELEELEDEFTLIKEKFESDLWECGIKKDDYNRMLKEAIQLNAMVIKFILSTFEFDEIKNENVEHG